MARRVRLSPHCRYYENFAQIDNLGPTPIYVTIEDAAEVDAREAGLATGSIETLNQWLTNTPDTTYTQVAAGTDAPLTFSEMGRTLAQMNRVYRQPQLYPVHPDQLEAIRRAMGFDPGQDRFSPESRERALQLLYSHSTAEQRADWDRHNAMIVKGSSTGDNYNLTLDAVQRMTDQHTFCLVIEGERCPKEDAVLMRKLMIETNEPEFLRLANDLTAQRHGIDVGIRDMQGDHLGMMAELRWMMAINEGQVGERNRAETASDAMVRAQRTRWDNYWENLTRIWSGLR